MEDSRRIWVAKLIMDVTRCNEQSAEMLIERLMEEGLLVLGYGDNEIDMVVNQFTESFGTTKVTRQDRWAAQRLVRKYGGKAVVGIIRMLASRQNESYAPVTNSVVELEKKFVSVVSFIRKQGEQGEVIDA